jgi:hypothetical protein
VGRSNTFGEESGLYLDTGRDINVGDGSHGGGGGGRGEGEEERDSVRARVRPPVLSEPRMVDRSLHPCGGAGGNEGADGNQGGSPIAPPGSSASGAIEGRVRRALMVRPGEQNEFSVKAQVDAAGTSQAAGTEAHELAADFGRMLTF